VLIAEYTEDVNKLMNHVKQTMWWKCTAKCLFVYKCSLCIIQVLWHANCFGNLIETKTNISI